MPFKYVFAFLLFSLPVSSFAQHAVASTTNTRMMYMGIQNKLSVAMPGYACADISIAMDSCMIEGSACDYSITPKYPGNRTLRILSKKTKKLLDTITIPVRILPEPVVQLGITGDGGHFFLPGPQAYIQAWPGYYIGLEILEFGVIIYHDKQIVFHEKNNGPRYNEAVLNAIGKMIPKDMIAIENVIVIGPDNIRRKLPGTEYKFF